VVRPPGPIRALSQRQLPTDHDPAVSIRAYQSDQSSRTLHRCHLLYFPNRKSRALPSRESAARKNNDQTLGGLTSRSISQNERRKANCITLGSPARELIVETLPELRVAPGRANMAVFVRLKTSHRN
jgi:hypothetical protein